MFGHRRVSTGIVSDGSDRPVDESQVEPLPPPLLTENPEEPPPGRAWINTTTRRLVVSTPDGLLSSPMEVVPTASSLESQFALDFYIFSS